MIRGYGRWIRIQSLVGDGTAIYVIFMSEILIAYTLCHLCSLAAGKCVHQQSTRLLQRPTRRCNEWPAYEASVRSECRRSIRHDVPEIRPYHARPPWPALVTCPPAHHLQGDDTSLQMFAWFHATVSRWGPRAGIASLSGGQHLRSADTCKLFVPMTSTNYESRSFAVHGPNSWNSLPAELRLPDTLTTFRRKLKTHLFSLWLLPRAFAVLN